MARRKAKKHITHADVIALVRYDKETGEFINAVTRGGLREGIPAGCVNKRIGYRYIRICNTLIPASHVAWMYVHGRWPNHHIDHKNGNRADNRLENLRAATQQQNNKNLPVRADNTSGATGLYWIKRLNKWQAYITAGKRTIRLGCFSDKSDAIAARVFAEKIYHGEFSQHASRGLRHGA